MRANVRERREDMSNPGTTSYMIVKRLHYKEVLKERRQEVKKSMKTSILKI